jgi:hypothetical protein
MSSSPHGGKAARDALERLALSLDAGAFVDVDARAVHLRRTRDDAVGECLRNYQLCASAKLSRDANLRSVLTPIVRWTVCARLLDVVGRAVDGGVEKDVRAAVAAVAAAADARDDDDAHHLSLPATGGSIIPDELFSQPGPLRTPASRTDTTRALVEDIDRHVTELAETMLGGWKGTPIVRTQREDPRRSISADGEEDPLDIEFIHSAKIVAEDFAERLCDPDATLTMRECVDHLLTPVAVALANAAARRATRRTIDGPTSSTSNELLNAWIDLPPRCAVAAADCCERVHGIATDFHREDFRKASRKKDTAVFGFGIASLTGVDIFPGGGGGDRSTDVNSAREVAASSGLGAAALRKACAEGIVAAELLAAQRTSYAAAVADAAKRGITPGLTPIRSNPRPVNRDGNEKEVRHAAMGTVRRCETSQLCRRTLANARIVSALSPMETTKDKGSRGRHEAHLYAGSIGGSIVEGSQVAKDFTREGSGLSIAVGLDAPFETVATGPFHAHFVAACGAVERALRSSGTLTTSTKDSESKDFIQSSSLNSNADEKKKSRWMSPPTSPGSKKKRTIDASDDVDRCSAAAAARVMLAASRTVRGGDALEFVLTMFPPEDGEFILIIT